jgi:hypothetical protein
VALSVVFSGLWLGNPAEGEAATVPTNLSVGDQYRLVFVTSTVHDAFSTDINTYNSIVDALGDPAIASDWNVIGATATDNTATPIATSGVSIWPLDDVEVGDYYADLWGGSIDAAIWIDEAGYQEAINNLVWTGTSLEGTKGDTQGADYWITFTTAPTAQTQYLYGMSGVYTVAAATVAATAAPEPSSAILLGVGVGVGWIRFRRKRRQASSTV